MITLILLFHLMACIALIAIVLLQTGKGAEMGAAFGGASQTLFGGSGGGSFMSKLTTGAAIVFMITCLLLSFIHRPGLQSGKSVMTDVPEQEQPKAEQPAPQQQPAPEARPVQPEGTSRAPQTSVPASQGPGAAQKAADAPKQVPAGTSKQPAQTSKQPLQKAPKQ